MMKIQGLALNDSAWQWLVEGIIFESEDFLHGENIRFTVR
jgi:hypothetical protein